MIRTLGVNPMQDKEENVVAPDMTAQAADHRFVQHLRRLVEREDRAALAALRRGLGKAPGTVAEMYPHVVPYLPPDASRRDEEPFYLIAALFAWHQGIWSGDGETNKPTHLGASFARMRTETTSDSVEKRFVALLNCDREDLPEHLRQAVGLLKSKDVPIDWLQLLRDIRYWETDRRTVQRKWSRAFWSTAARDEELGARDA